jgi:hypothetical protein
VVGMFWCLSSQLSTFHHPDISENAVSPDSLSMHHRCHRHSWNRHLLGFCLTKKDTPIRPNRIPSVWIPIPRANHRKGCIPCRLIQPSYNRTVSPLTLCINGVN